MAIVNDVPTGKSKREQGSTIPSNETTCNKGLKLDHERISEDYSSDLNNIFGGGM